MYLNRLGTLHLQLWLQKYALDMNMYLNSLGTLHLHL